MSSKSKTQQKTTMTYGDHPVVDTPDIIAARTAANTDTGPDPTIQHHFARQKKDLSYSMANRFGANVAPETLEAMRYAREADIDREQGAALKEDAFRRREGRFQRLYAMAGLTQPKVVQTGGSMTGTASQPIWPGMVNAGIGAAVGAF